MEYNYLYLIEEGERKDVVSAKSSVEAINLWAEHKRLEWEEEGKRVRFNPDNFSITKLKRKDLVINASE
ncbi:hypothetical protein CN445_09235 [Bacillus cereus]|uniref:hypothetical protein n=1 Tax=Bacillus TaxID=1386 RepID=UPI000BED20BE|nr:MULTISPECIES: hypothetical protein [Bacillus cereus group]MCU4809603.1 hypothetical protein [Bacillus cereus]PEF09006.1 hypothetical protein CON23_29405 [Bacillus thuringiensis]PEF16530.1 hypothetical protein CON87_23580 [Bacillus cereus]PET09922.1 hypothetical protein CN516_18205 [Bacillus cereus]PEV88307.1 hypothetical protein CN433_16700 [Bacillus cereus]